MANQHQQLLRNDQLCLKCDVRYHENYELHRHLTKNIVCTCPTVPKDYRTKNNTQNNSNSQFGTNEYTQQQQGQGQQEDQKSRRK